MKGHSFTKVQEHIPSSVLLFLLFYRLTLDRDPKRLEINMTVVFLIFLKVCCSYCTKFVVTLLHIGTEVFLPVLIVCGKFSTAETW